MMTAVTNTVIGKVMGWVIAVTMAILVTIMTMKVNHPILNILMNEIKQLLMMNPLEDARIPQIVTICGI